MNFGGFMKIEAYQQSVMVAQIEAKLFVAHSEVKQFKPILEAAEWPDFYEGFGVPEASKAFDDSQRMLADEIVRPILDKLFSSDYSEKEFFYDVDRAEQLMHYCFLELLGKTPDEVNPDWVSKSLSRNCLVDALEREYHNPSLIRKVRNWSFFTDHERRMAERIYDLKLGDTCLTFYDAFERYSIKESYRDFLRNADPAEFLSVILNYAENGDGFYDHLPKDQILNYVVAKTARVMFNDPNIGQGDISALRSEGVIKSMPLWDSQYFHNFVAPVTTDEKVAKVAALINEGDQHKTFFEIKDSLSNTEILSYFLKSSGLNQIDNWAFGMAAFEAVTGERLSFREARELKPTSHFRLATTQAYSDLTDKNMNAEAFRKIDVSVTRDEDEDYKYDDGEKAVIINIDCKTLSIDSISEEISTAHYAHSEIRQSGSSQDGIWFELAIDSADPLKIANSIALQLTEKLQVLNKSSILPGDLVKVDHEDAEDHELLNGRRFVVTDVHMSGDLKLKGMAQYFPGELFSIKKKYEPQQAINPSFGR
jgi:hypothetical protein